MPENAKTYLFVINDAPYGNERPFNALRLASNLIKRSDVNVKVFLVGDGVNCAINGQKTPNGYYNVERMVKSIATRGEVATWGSCVEARGLGPERIIEEVKSGSLDLLGEWTVAADQVLIF